MKTLKLTSALFCFLLGTTAYSQAKPDSLGLPGDNFDLYGALELFKKADTPENFEKALNSNDNEVNNLDLDGDGKVDYVKVVDKKDGDAHTLVLQVAVSASELQDVAVIEVEKTGDDKAHVQIVGDEELYGKDYIIEPKDETETTAAKKTATTDGNQGSNDDVYSTSDNSNRTPSTTNNNTTNNYYNDPSPNQTVVVNVWAWPSVRYIYGPSYAVWSSPWYWNTYPVWWSPWQPVYWRYHHRRAWHYHYPYYHRVGYYRSPRAHNWYYGRRTSSQTVRNHRESGFYTQKQMTYKNNTPRGQKYNNQPARRDGMQKQNLQGQPQKAGGVRQQGNLQKQQGVKQQPMQSQPIKQQPTNKGQMQQQQPIKQQQPVKQQMPKQQQPMQQQPIKQQMPKQQHAPRQQSMPKQQHTAPAQKMQHGGGGGRPR